HLLFQPPLDETTVAELGVRNNQNGYLRSKQYAIMAILREERDAANVAWIGGSPALGRQRHRGVLTKIVMTARCWRQRHNRLALREYPLACGKQEDFRAVYCSQFVSGTCGARAIFEAVVIHHDKASLGEARIKKLEAVAGRLIQIYVNMHEAERTVCHFIESFWDPARKYLN